MEMKQIKAGNGWINIVTGDDGEEIVQVFPNALKLVDETKKFLFAAEKTTKTKSNDEDDL